MKHTDLKPVQSGILWAELFSQDMDEATRRDRWEQWKSLTLQQGDDGKEAVEYWTDPSACGNCIHRDGDWCKSECLPVTTNPVLTFRMGMIGMACAGGGKELPEGEEPEIDEEADLPF